MSDDLLTPLKRQTLDICVYGGKGRGKTLYMVYYAFRKWLDGYTIYSNFSLKFPFVPVVSLEDLDALESSDHALFLGDDFEQWLNSRLALSKSNRNITEILVNFGKKNISLIYSCKRPKNVDVMLRNTTDYWVEINLDLNPKLILSNPDLDFEEASKYLENLVVHADVYDYAGVFVQRETLYNLQVWANLYDTLEMVKKIT